MRLLVSRSLVRVSDVAEFLLIPGLFLLFLLHFIELLIFVLSLVFAMWGIEIKNMVHFFLFFLSYILSGSIG